MRNNPALDGLRAVAVVAVAMFHCSRDVLPGGFIGVDMFFVLSGYLITSMLLEERQRSGTIDFARFYARRALRLWPALLLMLAMYLVAAPFVFPGTNAGRDALLAGFYLSDYARAFWGVPYVALSHTWSLAVEEHFYLLWPIIVLFLSGLDRRVAILLLVCAFVLATIWRIIDLAIWLDFKVTYYRFDTRMSGLVLGSLIAFMQWRPNTAGANGLAAIGALLLGGAMLTFHWGLAETLIFPTTIVDVGSGCVVLALASGGSFLAGILSKQPFVYIGTVSYSIYLFHYPIVVALRETPTSPLSWTAIISVLVSAVLLASLSYEFVEKPVKNWRTRRFAAA